MSSEESFMKRILIPLAAFLLGVGLMAGAFFGIFTALQGWEFAAGQFASNRDYVIPIWLAFGVQAAIYSVLRFRLFLPAHSTVHGGALLGTSGGASVTTMVACCVHHVADVLPVLGVSAATMFLTRYQRPLMRISLGLNLLGILIMLIVLYRACRDLQPAPDLDPVLEG